MVVVEANEVPLRVVADNAPSGETPFLASLLANGRLIETEVGDDLDRELYPSQSWASMNTGVGYEKHGVYWYGDPKPVEFPLYWQQAAAAGLTVGLVNTLHSSPLATQCVGDRYRFVVPDCFSADSDTVPAELSDFQQLNLRLTKSSARRTRLGSEARQIAKLVPLLPQLGVRGRTMVDLTSMVAGVASRRIPTERLRSAQFLLLGDLFVHLLERHAPDLAVFFTNHVAASMHRYWYARYPNDFEDDHYDDRWVRRHRQEIPAALASLDRFLRRVDDWCTAHDRTLVVASSMGQGPSPALDAGRSHEAVVVDPQRFVDALGIDSSVVVRGAMVPQLTLACGSASKAEETDRILVGAGVNRAAKPSIDRSGDVITLTYDLDVVGDDAVRLGGEVQTATSVGVEIQAVEDHSSGRHVSRGVLGVTNSSTFDAGAGGPINALDVAPAVLSHLGVEPAQYHRTPSIRL